MRTLHALELLPDAPGRDAVRRDWQALRDAGLRSQLDHQGATHAPHLTLVEARGIGPDEERLAAELLGPLLPVRVRAAGLVLLGGRRLTVARTVDVPDEVMRAVLALREAIPGRQHDGWLPHLTLARRLPREHAQRAVDVLGHDDVELSLVELRRWDPETASVRRLAVVE
jgi:hypothetical protein